MIRAVFFDMDGTMYDTERLSTEGWLKASAELGYNMTMDQVLAFRGHNTPSNKKMFEQWFGEQSEYYRLRSMRDKYMNDYMDQNGVPVKKGLYQLLKVLREKGIKMCIATGTTRAEAGIYWNKTGVLDYIQYQVCGDEIDRCKPAPDTFLAAAAKVEEKPENCLVLEDSVSGVEAAVAAGCHVIVIPDLDQPTDSMRKACDAVCDSMCDVADLFSKCSECCKMG